MTIHRLRTIEEHDFDPDTYKGNSNKTCILICDYCGSEYSQVYHKIKRGRKNTEKDACNNKACQTKKREEVFFKKYGVTHPGKNEEVKEKRKKTFIKNLGVDNPFKLKIIQEKAREGVFKKYGVDNVAKLEEVKQKRKDTNLKRYGVEAPIQNEEIKKRIYKTIKERYGVNHYGELQKIDYLSIKKYCETKGIVPRFTSEEYKNRRQKLKFYCSSHGVEFESTLENISRNGVQQCPKCKPYRISRQEQEIAEFCKSLGTAVEQNVRTIINGELDVYLPEHNLAIEHNGLYWHSEIFKDKDYHYDKFKQCKDKGIQLIQFCEDEWRDKKEICQSMIAIKTKNKDLISRLGARQLILNAEPSHFSVKNFLEENHLQGSCKFSKAFTLENENKDILFCVAFRKPFTKNKQGVVEVARLCSKRFHTISGAFSRVMKVARGWAKDEGFEKILTYSDCRYSFGDTYSSCGFEFIGHTNAGYDYTDFICRFGRFKFRAKGGKSERDIALENEVFRIFNTGNFAWYTNLEA